MSDDQITDLKQFITATISQQLALQTSDFDDKFAQIDQRFAQIDQRFAQIDQRFARIDQRFENMDEKFDEIMNAVGGSFKQTDDQLADHEQRIIRLEHSTA